MGALYVLEGSLLGGCVIARHLTGLFGARIAESLTFYQCYGANLDTEWQSFIAFMGQCFDNQDDETINEVIDSAIATFAHLHAWVEECSENEMQLLAC